MTGMGPGKGQFMTRDDFVLKAVALKAKLDKHLEVAQRFREADPSLSRPGAVEDYEILNAESTQAANDWFKFCSENARNVK
jgi:hypothetical protein